MPSIRYTAFLIAAVLATTSACDRDLRSARSNTDNETVSPALFRTAMAEVPCDDVKRFGEVRSLFEARGLTPVVRRYERAENLEVEVAGRSRDIIIVGAHYDKTTLGCGAIDNWAGILLLVELTDRFSKETNNKTIKFVAFGGEEKGLIGSAAMANEIEASRRRKPCAMVNLDSFGFDKTWGLANISDQPLLMLAAGVERARGGSFSIRNYRGATSDSRSFQMIDVPAITLSGVNKNWREFLHQSKDQALNIDFEMLSENYSFLHAFLREIDSVSCEAMG